ncbi:MAG: HAD family hydrolase [Chloroflexota bacterium]|nr:HAD family hydrolase [Chloroflexota bacterium]
MSERAIFLDRDGTLVYPCHYPSRPEHLRLFPDIGAGLRLLQGAGFRLIVITNQSGIARGLFDEHDLNLMHESLRHDLGDLGVTLDGIYYCPHHSEGVIPEFAMECSCRKPRPGMLQRAAADRNIDLERSWFLGDILDDVEAGNRAGTRTILLDLDTESVPSSAIRRPSYVAQNSNQALGIVGAIEGLGCIADLTYLPTAWGSRGAIHAGH